MVDSIAMRTYGVNHAFRFVEGIWLHRKIRRIRKCFRKDLFYIVRLDRMFVNSLLMQLYVHIMNTRILDMR